MSRLFKKIVRLTVWRDSIPNSSQSFTQKQLVPGEQLEITQQRIRFKVERSLTKPPNQTDVYISNLSEANRQDMATRPLRVQLEAGYDNTPRLLSIGDLHFGMSELKSGTWDTLLQCGDGDRAYSTSRVNRSYGKGTTVRTIVQDAAKSMGLTLPKNLIGDATLDTQALTGDTSFGFARDELTRLLAPYGYSWSIQNGSLLVLRDEEISSTDALPIDAEHGMIDTPQYGSPPKSGKPPHVRVKMLLYPELTPGDLVQIKSISFNGLYRIEKVEHNGDTHSQGEGDFTTTAEVTPSGGGGAGLSANQLQHRTLDLEHAILDKFAPG